MSKTQDPFQQIRRHPIALGTHLGSATEATDRQYFEAIAFALRRGCDVIDTAPNYRAGRSEEVVRDVCAALGTPHGGVLLPSIVTKAGFLPPAPKGTPVREVFERLARSGEAAGRNVLDPIFVRASLEWSRATLAPARCNFVLLHNPELHLPRLGEAFYDRIRDCFAALEEECSAGRLQGYGISTWSGLRVPLDHPEHIDLSTLLESLTGSERAFQHFGLVQLPFNMVDTEAFVLKNQHHDGKPVTTLEFCTAFGLTVMASNPLHQGALATLPPEVTAALPDYRSDALRAIQFVRSTPGIATTIVGMKTVEHVSANLELLDTPPLTDSQYAQFFE
jgi:aryl-alcohol dehydrogenase-like predicted oxidoreductase